MSKRKRTRKLQNEDSSITISRSEEGTTWKVHVSQDAFANSGSTEQGRFKFGQKNPNRDTNSGVTYKFGQWNASTLPRDGESVLNIHDKKFQGNHMTITSGTTSSSQQNVRRSFLCENRITSARRCSSCCLSRASSKYGAPLRDDFAMLRKTPTFPSIQDVLHERMQMWPNREPDHLRYAHHLPTLRAPKAFQPKIPKNFPFSVELTKPFVFSYYQKLNWQ